MTLPSPQTPPANGTVATVGARLAGRYELVAPIANGGMAQVWRATDCVLGRPVAVKVLHPHLATDRAFVVRFRREAVAAARLSHPGIVSIYDTVASPGLEAIVMELVEGRTLRAVLDDRTVLSPADGVDLGIQIADALDAAHSAGVVHRDIKPSNILLCPDRRVMVTDFGIAKAGEDTDLTVTGTLLGTAKYLSPEQVRGDEVDPRSDLYSLGVVLFEALTGRPPFQADTDAATALARLQQQPPRLRHLNPELPKALDGLVDKLLARHPQDRFERALDVRAALTGIQLDPTSADATMLVAEPEYAAPVDPLAFDDEADDDFGSFMRSERSFLVPAAIVILVAVGLGVAGLLLERSPIGDSVLDFPSLGSGGDDDSGDEQTGEGNGDEVVTTGTTSLAPIQEVVAPAIVSIVAIDPQGDQEERPETVAFAIDHDPETYWRTDTYRRAGFANLKNGVGLVLDLGGLATVSEVAVDSPSTGWAVQLFLGDGFDGAPDSWGEPLVAGVGLDGNQTFNLENQTGRMLLLWFTDPGVSADGPDEGTEPDHRLEVTEVRVT